MKIEVIFSKAKVCLPKLNTTKSLSVTCSVEILQHSEVLNHPNRYIIWGNSTVPNQFCKLYVLNQA